MKPLFILLIIIGLQPASAQEIQLHYDFRHSVSPRKNPKNYPLLVFKYFKEIDTVGTGSFLFEVQSHLSGKKTYIGQAFIQASQSLKFWKPKIYLYANFSGGLGVADPDFGYFISNSYGLGVSVPLVFKKSWYSFSLMYRYSDLVKPSHDVQSNIYIGGGLMNYRLMYGCTLVAWATNKNNGLAENAHKKGKRLAFFADPQIWYGIGKGFSVGSRVSLFYHINNESGIQAFPTAGIKRTF